MVDQAQASESSAQSTRRSPSDRVAPSESGNIPLNITELAATANAAVQEQEATSRLPERPKPNDDDLRHDSAQDQVPQLPSTRDPEGTRSESPVLRLQTHQNPREQRVPADTIATSPTLGRHIIATPEGTIDTLPAYQASSPAREGSATSPQGEKLPSFHQVIAGQLGPLGELAEAATQQDQRATIPNHKDTFSSSTVPSQMLQHQYAQASASPYYIRGAKSPTSTISEQMYTSPVQFPGAAYYADRRSAAVPDRQFYQPPSLPSASSSGDSHGMTNSSMDSYSTAQTTPSEGPEITNRPMSILPPPPGMPQSAVVLSAGFVCDYPGCTAAPFQTQYLLSSHKNVHSQVRNHYCPVKDCPRSEGGKGFKRKNEMIRHGLVHDSPGYVCPFCPDKEHRYPRPDNLQRHVRVHHVDKDKEDPQLREVLAQRREGQGKTRRRRANTAGSSS